MWIAFWGFSPRPLVKTAKVPKSFIFTLIFQLFYYIKKLKSCFYPYTNLKQDFGFCILFWEVIKKYLTCRQTVDVDSYEIWRYFL